MRRLAVICEPAQSKLTHTGFGSSIGKLLRAEGGPCWPCVGNRAAGEADLNNDVMGRRG